jgi:hypothetical protein
MFKNTVSKALSFATGAFSFATGACSSYFITSAILSDQFGPSYQTGVIHGYEKAREELRQRVTYQPHIDPLVFFLLPGHEMELLGDTYIVKLPPRASPSAWFLRKEDAEQIEDDIQRRIEDTGPPPGVDISTELVGMKRNVSDARDLADCVVMATSAKLEAAMKRFPGEDPTNK